MVSDSFNGQERGKYTIWKRAAVKFLRRTDINTARVEINGIDGNRAWCLRVGPGVMAFSISCRDTIQVANISLIIVTGDETWLHHTPIQKSHDGVEKHMDHRRGRRLKVTPFSGKVIATISGPHDGVI
ncbi:hypothetical protein NPIL_333331 [Nephila pilipes]|uniref:Uncharacterized protein n=1 Tax=Nephila pilipes TaxID=299642 RepID=A0A8X6N551_NEPPI|nr:hypothetical protein NPIL_333331 [Nephila pilipes]